MALLLAVPAFIAAMMAIPQSANALFPPPVQALPAPLAQYEIETETLRPVSAMNFDEVEPGFYRGGLPTVKDVSELKRLGVKTVIDFTQTGGFERIHVEKQGMNYVNIPWSADWNDSAFHDYDRIAEQFLEIVTDPAQRPVYVHCIHGRDRTGMMTAVYRVNVQGWDLRRAIREMNSYGFNNFTHFHMVKFLMRYVRSLAPASAPSVNFMPLDAARKAPSELS